MNLPKISGPGNPPIIAFTVLGGGGLLLLAAVYNLDPLQALKNLFTGQNPLDAHYNPLSGAIINGSSVVKGGQTAPNDALNKVQGQGVWVKNGTNEWFWESYYTLAQAKQYAPDFLKAAGNPPGASPPWMFDGSKWIDSSKLVGPMNDPSKAPTATSLAVPDPVQNFPGQPTSSVGGSDPTGIAV